MLYNVIYIFTLFHYFFFLFSLFHFLKRIYYILKFIYFLAYRLSSSTRIYAPWDQEPCVPCSLLCPQCLQQCLTHSRDSINVYLANDRNNFLRQRYSYYCLVPCDICDIFTLKIIVVYLKFKLNRVTCIFPGNPTPRTHLAISRDLFDCHHWNGGVENRDAAKHLTMHRTVPIRQRIIRFKTSIARRQETLD